jgi:hypothetical protein
VVVRNLAKVNVRVRFPLIALVVLTGFDA